MRSATCWPILPSAHWIQGRAMHRTFREKPASIHPAAGVRAPRAVTRLQRYLLRYSLGTRFALGLLFLYVCVALFGEFLAPESPTAMNLAAPLRPPSAEHLFGTDNY